MNLFTSLAMLAIALAAAANPTPTPQDAVIKRSVDSLISSTAAVKLEVRDDTCRYCLVGQNGALTATPCDNSPTYPTCFPANMDPDQPIATTAVDCLVAQDLPYCVMYGAELWASSAYYVDGMGCGGVPATTVMDGDIPMPTECM